VNTAAAALACTVGEVSTRVSEASSAGLVNDVDAVAAFSFVHDLVREVIYESLAPASRSQLHLFVAQSLEGAERARTPEGFVEIAHHYAHAVQSGGAARAMECALRAAKSELEKFAYEAAREHFQRAVALMDEWNLGDSRLRCAVLTDLGRAELNSGNDNAAWEAFERATNLARGLQDTEAMMRITLALTGSIGTTGIHFDPRLFQLLEELLAMTDDEIPKVRGLLLSRLIFTLAWVPDQPKKTALAREAHDLIERIRVPRVRAWVAMALCFGMDQPGDLGDRLRKSEEGVHLARVAGDLEASQFAHVVHMLSLLEAGRLAEIPHQTHAYRDVVGRLRLRGAAAMAAPLAHAGLLAHIEGRLPDLERMVAGLESIAGRTGDLHPKSLGDVQRAFLNLEDEKLAASVETARIWVTLVPGLQPWQCFLTFVLARAGQLDEATARLRSCVPSQFELQSDWHWLYCMALLADACATLGEREAAGMVYDRLSPYGDRCVTIGAACIFLGSVERYLGRLADVTGRLELAHEHFERAHAIHSKSGARLMLAHSLCDHVLLLERAPELGRGERAAELRVQATKLADEIGSAYLRRRLGERRVGTMTV
jgi:tetratricopeptide (TPR) repeat protein